MRARWGWWSRGWLAVAAGVLVGLALPAPASAHAYLVRSAPADGSVLDRAPEVLTLSFTENVELASTTVDIIDGDGRHWASRSIVERRVETADGATTVAGAEQPVEVVVGLPVLPMNTYHVSWRTLSSDDLHLTSGTLVFGVQREVSGAGGVPGPAGPGPRESTLRAVSLTGFAVLFGGAALALITEAQSRGRRRRADSDPAAVVADPDPADGTGTRPSLTPRLLAIALFGGVVALVAVPVQLLVQVSAGGGQWRRLFAEQASSGRWLAREAGLAAMVAVMAWVARRWRTQGAPDGVAARVVVALGGAGALATAVGTALLGHTTSGGSGAVLTAVAGTVHVLAAGGWAGSVIAAGITLVPVLRAEPGRAAQIRALLRAFTVVALACVTALVVTGLVLAAAQVSTVDSLLLSPYGLLLLAKVGAVAAAGLLGLRTSRRLHRAAGEISARRLVAEAVVLVGVLALAGTLAAAGPAKGPRFPVASSIATVPEVSGQASDIIDALTVRPNRPGHNLINISVDNTRRPAPGPITGVSLSLTGPDGTARVHPVTRTADGWSVATDDIRTPGAWRIGVTVMRDGLAPVTDTHTWVVAPAGAVADPVVSAAPVGPALDVAAVVVALAAAAGLVLAIRRRRLGSALVSRSNPGLTTGAEQCEEALTDAHA
jgi:copper transport protein